jgi:hypothetical protein
LTNGDRTDPEYTNKNRECVIVASEYCISGDKRKIEAECGDMTDQD